MVFSEGATGRLIQNLISLLIIPAICGFIVGIVFWLIKREAMPHIMAVVWVLWLILLVTMLAQTDFGHGKTVNRLAKQQNFSSFA
jgi:hypothetical protein